MTRLGLLAVSLPSLVLVAAAPARAQQEVEQEGVFQRLEVSLQERVLLIRGGSRFGVSGEVYARHQALLESLRDGDRVVLSHRGGRLTNIRRFEQDLSGSRRRNVTAQFERLVSDGQRRWLVLSAGRQLLVDPEVYERHKTLLEFLKKGDALRITVEGGHVIDLARGGRTRELDPELEERLLASRHGDLVTVNGELYRFISANLSEVRLQPRTPGSEPPTFLEGAQRAIPLEQLVSFDNPRLAEGGGDAPRPGAPEGKDAFDGVRVGDTVGIDFDVGQVTALTDTHFTWRIWRNEEWGPPEAPRPRASVTSGVRPVALPSQHTLQIEGGELFLKVSRRRSTRDGGLAFDVEVSHALPGTILVGTRLRFLLGDVRMTSDSPPLGTEELLLPSLFEAQTVKVRHVSQLEGACDGRVEVVIAPEDRVSISSPAARRYLLQALEQAATAKDTEGLARVYVAAGRNGDKALCHLLVSRALAEQEPARRAPILQGLEAFGQLTATVVLEDLVANDRNLQTSRLERGEVRRGPLPQDERPRTHKRRLVGLLADVPGALRPPAGGRLFDIYLQSDDLNEAIEAAFARRPAEAVASLLDVATSTTAASTSDQQKRAERAAGMLQKMGATVLDEIVKELRRREIAVDRLQRAIEQGARPSDAVHLALETLIQDASRKRRIELDKLVEQARAMAGQGQLAEAANVLRGVLAQDAAHGPALETTPGVLLQIADERRKAGDREEAGAHLEEALAYLAPAEQPRSKAILAELLVDALAEEVEENAVRAAPADLAKKVGTVARDQPLQGPEVAGGWVELTLGPEARGYVRMKSLVPAAPGSWIVREVGTPFEVIDALLTRAATLSPTVSVRCGELRGRVYARDAKTHYDQGNFAAALPLFSKASELAPTDPRLELEWSCWFQAYKTNFIGLGALILLLVGVAAMQMFARPRRVKWQGDYKHYGANRAQRERDLEVDDAAAQAEGDVGAPPPSEGQPS